MLGIRLVSGGEETQVNDVQQRPDGHFILYR